MPVTADMLNGVADRDAARIRTIYKHDGTSLKVIKTQTVDSILNTVKELPEHVSRTKVRARPTRLFASIPAIIALKWAEESQTKLYSHEWVAYVSRKLESDEWARLKVKY